MNWRERLLEEGATRENVLLARSWTTCYIGEVAEAHPDVVLVRRGIASGGQPAPLDRDLNSLGYGFFNALDIGNVESALEYADRIDDRVLELKRQKADTVNDA